MSDFKKVLIANRGEIARRIIRTCKRLSIPTVAVYSEADASALFVKEANEAVLIGPAPVKKSYLDIDSIIAAAKDTGADAIHPGYGFLAENSTFAERCTQEGITFIGPKAAVIRLMGDKIEARKQMKAAGIAIVPGACGALTSIDEAKKVAGEIGYPIMLKASAGGGGIGMQIVYNDQELEKAFESTAQRAGSYFGDDTLFLEKYISSPRHIEVQLAGDEFGNIVHLWERECSIQRRNQKIIEEAPSPFLDPAAREALCAAAVKGAASIGYTSVGTMEFIVDEQGNYYFLEMNTRIQVEHPVTEEITGIDLVEWQLNIASGKPLDQEVLPSNPLGHAIECRVYAEDPRTFMPSPGKIDTLTLPVGVRLEFAVAEGDQVTPFYDPMIGKVITHGTDRQDAIQKMKEALKQCQVSGIKNNLPLLESIMDDSAFQAGIYTTKFVETLLKG
ncbi:acetyl-CoA carboxylase biotin carboxylase subunit [Brevibacillus sp. NRS-1366]|uniref:acetyl-CoA carboxylase biotin carboxylase subunit n=1 Tax=Brevibacillus sp. NRS-1366 TaxID=3233899 RepID=UPI003D247ABC